MREMLLGQLYKCFCRPKPVVVTSIPFVRNVVNNFSLHVDLWLGNLAGYFIFNSFLIDINPALVEVLTEVFKLILNYVIPVIIISLVIAFYNCNCVINKEGFFCKAL